MQQKTREKLLRRCMDPDWVKTPLGEFTQLYLDYSEHLSIADLAEVLDKHRPDVHQWLTVCRNPGRSESEVDANNKKLTIINSTMKVLYDSKVQLNLKNLKVYYEAYKGVFEADASH